MIDESSQPSSIFHPSNSNQHTDATVYPEPNQEQQRKDSKKRKVQEGENGIVSASVADNARYAELVHSNKHLEKVHNILKAEFEQLGILCVSVLYVSISGGSPF